MACEDPLHAEKRRASNGTRITCSNCWRCCFCPIADDKEDSECVLHHYPRPKGPRNKRLFTEYKWKERASASIAEDEAAANFVRAKEALGIGDLKFSRKRPYKSADKDLPTLSKLYRAGCSRLGEILCPGEGPHLEKKG